MKRIILCADDYGQNPAISQAIIDLIKKKRLSATSCMVTSEDWESHADWLKPLSDQVDIGLHFNLTEGKPLSTALDAFFSLRELLFKTHLYQLPKKAVTIELNTQLDKFVKKMGKLPNFIDGHQHIHQFPVIRDSIIEVYEERLRAKQVYVRCTGDWSALYKFKSPAYLKQLIIQACGTFSFKRKLAQHHIPHNSSFAGIYDFKNSANYSKLFPQFLTLIAERGLIMCHPGLASDNSQDSINVSRHHEYQYFNSDTFIQTCFDNKISLTRMMNN